MGWWRRIGASVAVVVLLTWVLSGCQKPSRSTNTTEVASSNGATSAPSPAATGTATGYWGWFRLVPPGEDTSNGAPSFGPDATRTGDLSGASAAQLARAQVAQFVDLPKEVYASLNAEGLEVQAAKASQDSSGHFDSWILLGRVEPRPALVELRAYTPAGPVAITVVSGSPVYVTSASTEINGYATVTKFATMAVDPYADQSVMWSQGTSVYVLHAYGPFGQADLLAWARAVSNAR